MGILIVLVVLGTTVWVGYDSSSLQARGAGQVGSTSTGGWVLCCLLLWIVGFPVYLVQRAKLLAAPPVRQPWQPGPWTPAPDCGAPRPPVQHAPAPGSGAWSAAQPMAPAPRSAAHQAGVTEELERLGRLREAGHLTDGEFVTLKGRLLD